MLKVLDLGSDKLVSSAQCFSNQKNNAKRHVLGVLLIGLVIPKNSSHSYLLILRKMLSVKKKFDRKTINFSLETIPTNNKNFTTKTFAPEKSTKTRFF
jgi:hypothetical protein